MKNNSGLYIVDAVCGHVGRGKGVLKSFVVMANNAKEAAAAGRVIPRVKHDFKYAIQDVRKVTLDEFVIQSVKNTFDPYLTATSIYDQNAYCEELDVKSLENFGWKEKRKRSTKIGRKRYVNNYMTDQSELEEFKYVG